MRVLHHARAFQQVSLHDEHMDKEREREKTERKREKERKKDRDKVREIKKSQKERKGIVECQLKCAVKFTRN